jgi:hypothetical protein
MDMCIKTENYAVTESEFVSMVYIYSEPHTLKNCYILVNIESDFLSFSCLVPVSNVGDSVPQKPLIVSPGLYDSVSIFFSKQIDKVSRG